MADSTPPAWWGPDGVPGTDDDLVQDGISAHQAAQADVPPGFVRLDTGELRPIGGRVDRADGDDS